MENIYFTSYEGAVEALLRAKNRDAGKPVHNNTRVLEVGRNLLDKAVIGLKLHDTIIIRYYPDGEIKLNTGGWKTLTTKDRINTYTPFTVRSENSIWKIKIADKIYNFKDNMIIYPNGKVDGATTAEEIDTFLKNKKRINAYVTKFGDALPVEQPGGGDCWHCAFTTEAGKTMGDTFKDTNHLWSHIKENYFVPSLLYSAMKEAGYNDFAVGIYGVFKDTSNYTSKDLAKRALRRYLHKRLL